MAIIGFSTGALGFDNFELALRLLEPTRANAVELSALRASELPDLLSAVPLQFESLTKRYKYISFHAPTNFTDERDLVTQLEKISEMEINIVVHPDTIHDVSLWRALGSQLCLENMDARKKTGRTVSELSSFFSALPDARLCFDIAHARQVDPTMTEAEHILTEFRGRLAQVHMSEVDSKGKHFAMSFSAKRAYEPFAEILSDIPIILESVIDDKAIEPEIDAVIEILSHRTWASGGSDHRQYNYALEAPRSLVV